MIIGLCGYAGSGKDESARYLALKYGFVRVAFADKLKELALRIDPWIKTRLVGGREDFIRLSQVVHLLGWDLAKQQVEVRQFLQDIGNETRNVVHENVWVDAVIDDIESNRNVVITDVRYANEIQLVYDFGGTLVRIDREGVGAANAHVSEHEWTVNEFDFILNNDGTVADLAHMWDTVMGHLPAEEDPHDFIERPDPADG